MALEQVPRMLRWFWLGTQQLPTIQYRQEGCTQLLKVKNQHLKV